MSTSFTRRPKTSAVFRRRPTNTVGVGDWARGGQPAFSSSGKRAWRSTAAVTARMRSAA